MKHDLKLRDLRSLQELLDDLEWETELIGEETDYQLKINQLHLQIPMLNIFQGHYYSQR